MSTTTLVINVEYDEAITDPEAIASAADTLLETALSTPGLLDEYGNPRFGEFLVPKPMNSMPLRITTLRGMKYFVRGTLQSIEIGNPGVRLSDDIDYEHVPTHARQVKVAILDSKRHYTWVGLVPVAEADRLNELFSLPQSGSVSELANTSEDDTGTGRSRAIALREEENT